MVNTFNSLVEIGSIPFPLVQRPGGREGGWSRSQLRRQQKRVDLSLIYFLFSTQNISLFQSIYLPLFASQVSVSHSSLLFGPTMNSYGLSLRGGLYGYVVQTQFSPLWAAIIPRRRRYVPDHLVDSVSSIFHSWKHYRILDANQKRCCYNGCITKPHLHLAVNYSKQKG